MTETGFPLSNPYRPVSERTPGCVGSPTPGAKVALLDLDTAHLYNDTEPIPSDFQGELLVRTNALFDRYLNKPDATKEAFYTDSTGVLWFKTGDMASKIVSKSGFSY
jgi:long-subunit acyl-CoA synthetase (AMP-forming)